LATPQNLRFKTKILNCIIEILGKKGFEPLTP
jgi:hypothetical protein